MTTGRKAPDPLGNRHSQIRVVFLEKGRAGRVLAGDGGDLAHTA